MVPSLDELMLYTVTHNSISSKLYIHHCITIETPLVSLTPNARFSVYWERVLPQKRLLDCAHVKSTSPDFVSRPLYSRVAGIPQSV
jgi:hypothetical protein